MQYEKFNGKLTNASVIHIESFVCPDIFSSGLPQVLLGDWWLLDCCGDIVTVKPWCRVAPHCCRISGNAGLAGEEGRSEWHIHDANLADVVACSV